MTLNEEVIGAWTVVRDAFNWEECALCFALMGWTWGPLGRSPNAEELRATAQDLFDSAFDSFHATRRASSSSTGRLFVSVAADEVSIGFEPMSSALSHKDSEWPR